MAHSFVAFRYKLGYVDRILKIQVPNLKAYLSLIANKNYVKPKKTKNKHIYLSKTPKCFRWKSAKTYLKRMVENIHPNKLRK